MTTTVTNADELMDALEATKGGVINLAPGHYGVLNLWPARHPFVRFENEVVLKSADPANPAVFDGISLTLAKNLSFDGLMLDYNFKLGDKGYAAPFIMAGCSHIRVRNCILDGDVAEGIDAASDGFGSGYGLFVRERDSTKSDHITVTGNEFFNWLRAGLFVEVDDLVVTGNDVHGIRADGFNFAEVNRVLVEGNHLHDFKASPDSNDHRDFIQFWTNKRDNPSTDIVIRGNTLNSGAGDWTQSIFMRNEQVDLGRASREMFYQNIKIENNLIHNAHTHGITVGEVDGLVIANNTLLHNVDSGKDDSVYVPNIHLKPASVNVTIVNNITPRPFRSVNEDWSVGENIVAQSTNSAGENYVGDLFVNALAGAKATTADLQPKPGGFIQKLGVGAQATAVMPADNLPYELLVQVGGVPEFVVYRRVSSV